MATTDSTTNSLVHLNLANRMQLSGINQLWVADITFVCLQQEFVYLAVILDAYSRKVVGWALDHSLAAQLAVKAFAERDFKPGPGRPGSSTMLDPEYSMPSSEYGTLWKKHQIIASMSRLGNPWDNHAKCESFMKTLKNRGNPH